MECYYEDAMTEKCFVIMPITTPDALVAAYGGDSNHFSHVFEHLFVPAIKNAGFEPVQPVTQGADVIHAEIVKNLETSDLVLCDISGLNPNVFFELGCRTALNKPVCYVLDDLTRAIPFDTGIINHHKYSHALEPWTLHSEIERLSAHIRVSAERSSGKNMLWQYFGLKSSAQAPESRGEEQDRLSYLVMQVDSIKSRLDRQPSPNATYAFDNLPTLQSAWEPGSTFELPINYVYRDWDKVLEASELDLAQITRIHKQSERLPDIEAARSVIEQHVKELGELIDSEPQTPRGTRARSLQLRYRDLLSGKSRS
jgi:nucleoside 2-deoxyribosyltransferase